MTTRTYRKRYPRVPYPALRHHMSRIHVGTSLDEVRQDIETRATEASATPAETREMVRFALACHAENRNLYALVMHGRAA